MSLFNYNCILKEILKEENYHSTEFIDSLFEEKKVEEEKKIDD